MEYSTAKLWEVFQGYGKVNDAFIPNKKVKGGYVFGFVRYIRVSDIVKLEESLNTIVLEGRRISGNVALYDRENNSGEGDGRPTVIEGRSVGTTIPKLKSEVYPVVAVSPEISFKEVLTKYVKKNVGAGGGVQDHGVHDVGKQQSSR